MSDSVNDFVQELEQDRAKHMAALPEAVRDVVQCLPVKGAAQALAGALYDVKHPSTPGFTQFNVGFAQAHAGAAFLREEINKAQFDLLNSYMNGKDTD